MTNIASLRTLADLAPGASSVVSAVTGSDHIRRRLMEMGLVAGRSIQVLRRAPLGDPIEIVVMHYHVTLRLEQARFIQVDDAFPVHEHDDAVEALSSEPIDAEQTSIQRIALLGNPNCGKTTLFNALTGLRQRVGNYPGITVERKVGQCVINDIDVSVVDLPGTYSLSPQSPDERIAVQVLRGQCQETRLDAVILVADATNLARNLLLFTQCAELNIPLVIALSMSDIAERDGVLADTKKLADLCGIPVVAIHAHTGAGIDALKDALSQATRITRFPWHLNADVNQAVERITAYIQSDTETNALDTANTARRLLTGADPLLDARNYGGESLSTALEREQGALVDMGIDLCRDDIQHRYAWIESLCVAVLPSDATHSTRNNLDRLSLRIDNFLVHRFWGLVSFLVIMASVFISVFYLADPLMGMIESFIGAFGELCVGSLHDGPLKALIEDGIIAGVGGVIIFVPQIAILTLLLTLLEDSGYLARASFLMDRLLAACGLHGKSFVPLLSSHACAIPGIMAARSIEHRRDRLATILVAPFMVCAARLPVYYLMITVFFFDYNAIEQGLILLSLYIFGIVLAAGTAFLAKKTALKGPSPVFILEFPPYKVPMITQALRTVYRNSALFVKKAGTVILTFSICLWAALYYPRITPEAQQTIADSYGLSITEAEHLVSTMSEIPETDQETFASTLALSGITQQDYDHARTITQTWSSEQVNNSYAGSFGHFLEPFIAPMGYDWKIGIGLTGAFAAREVFVSTMGTVYSLGNDASEDSDSLHKAMRADTHADGSLLWTTPTAISLLIFFAIAMQCISTVAVVRQETGTWSWPLYQMLYMNVLAYILATLAYQIGTVLL